MPSLLRTFASRLRPVPTGDAAPKSLIRALLDAVANEMERLADALEKVADDSYVETTDGQKRRPDVTDRPHRPRDDP